MISVVTSTHNYIDKIDRLYQSLLDQTYKDFEWVICDNGSSDGTWDRIREIADEKKLDVEGYAQTYRGMRLARNLNNGFPRAKGELIFVVMGDSYLNSDGLELLHKTYVPGSAGSGLRRNVNEDHTFHSWDWRVPDEKFHGRIIDLTQQAHPFTLFCGNGLIASKKDLRRVKWWPEEYVGYGRDDWCLFLRLWRSGVKLIAYNNIIVNHFWHGHSGEDDPKNVARFEKELYGSKP